MTADINRKTLRPESLKERSHKGNSARLPDARPNLLFFEMETTDKICGENSHHDAHRPNRSRKDGIDQEGNGAARQRDACKSSTEPCASDQGLENGANAQQRQYVPLQVVWTAMQ